MADEAFNLLATPIQHVLWDMRWEELRSIQYEAIREILGTDHDLIISANTAAGKTEAAFLPILSRLYQQPPASVGAVYVGPLKALINDQFRRLEDLCQRAGIPVHRWHGDVDVGKKTRLLEQPGGVLLITPESLESMFVNRASAMRRLFADLQFVVIDEVHSLVGRERGLQLRSQLFRLGRYVRRHFRIIALSATIGDEVDRYKTWLAPEMPSHVRLIHDSAEHKQVFFGIQAFASGVSSINPESHKPVRSDDTADFPPELVRSVLDEFCGSKNLIFCNSRSDVEGLADSLNEALRRAGRPAEFLVHHGSVSKEIREHVEETMRGSRPATVICTSSLELGIDIGNLTAVGQIGPAWSASSLRQRLGRSGRHEGEPHRMRVMLRIRKAAPETELVEQLYPDLLQAIAVTELMRERWVEPPNLSQMDLSTFVQQILSILAETGGATADFLGQQLVSHGAFHGFPPAITIAVLRSLGRRGVIEQAVEGHLLFLTPSGEQIVHDRDFYSAFASLVEFAVRHNSQSIGSLPALFIPSVGDHLLLAGRRWQVESIDVERKEILVFPAVGRKPPLFFGGSGEIHSRVRQQMRDLVLYEQHYDYLSMETAELLSEARRFAARLKLGERQLVEMGDRSCVWFTWTGTKTQRTLACLMKLAGIAAIDKGIALALPVSQDDAVNRLRAILVKPISQLQLARQMPAQELRKFDRFLNDDLLYEAFAADYLDIEAAIGLVEPLLKTICEGRAPPNGKAALLPESSEQLAAATGRTECRSVVQQQPINAEKVRVVSLQSGPFNPSLLSDCEFVAFDLETTGLHPAFASIVEIGAVRFRVDGVELGRFQQLVDPGYPIPSDTTAVHRITAEMLRGAPSIADVLPNFLRFVGDSNTILIAHNAWFDRSFLGVAMSQAKCAATGHRIADTLALSRALLPGIDNYRLASLAARYRLNSSNCHRAIEDSVLVQKVFIALISNSKVASSAELLGLADAGFLEPAQASACDVPNGFEDLQVAIQAGYSVLMAYRGQKGEVVCRIRPFALTSSGGRDYLSALCGDDEAKRTFRLDRIRSFRLERAPETQL